MEENGKLDGASDVENATLQKTMRNMIRIVCASHKTLINSTPFHIVNHVVECTHDMHTKKIFPTTKRC